MDLEDVRESDRRVNSFIAFNEGFTLGGGGCLGGLSVAVKSNICVEGLLASAGSKTLEDYISPYDACVIERLKAEGGYILGMANMDEFACGGSGETSYYGVTQNPSAEGRIPGGSSSGCAAAVAAGFVDCALGSDTGGSIRNPASHCGVVGFKPTYGLVSRYGLIDLAMSLDQIGPLARDVETAALLLDVVSGYDSRDATSISDGPGKFSSKLDPDVKGMRLGYAGEFDDFISDKGIGRVVHSAVDRLSSLGAEVVDVSLPNLDLALPTYYLNVYVEFFSATRKFDGRRYGKRIEDVCGEEVLRRILLGRYISQKEYSGRYYRKALQARSLIRSDLEAALGGVDVLVGPVVPKLPHRLGDEITDPRVMYAYDIFTTPANLAGLPAGSVPAGKVDGIPTGLHVMGKPLEDQKVLNVMRALEEV
ncbi:MAG: Asp-tRNA(Asn)/Glu-tRNA(Gln) amidotransferase subunit GatA [Candidatus Altiarchaeales archaeon]|nr:Asp-tRNA(Asn)/Glu-tRNA(Gln) amidotransferase subunit GatA [Candidatus Altiarchaeales archaeon]MBD3416915.1 Asp-tRNA(Asn)/Glu-tRNA(Gln) amidotransferase subunit GatA [Candidatus Altiarchaeales archaeon]